MEPVRIVRTVHTAEGTSVFAPEDQLTPFQPFAPVKNSAFSIFDIRASVPVNNTDAIPSFAKQLPRCPPGGTIFSMTEIMAGDVAPMHRTVSLDYCYVASGEIVLALDGGEEKTLREGDVLVQQGVNHSWINRSEKSCKMIFVMVGAEKVKLEDGTVLEEAHPQIKKPE